MEFNEVFERGNKNEAFAEYFIGKSYLNMLSLKGVVIGNVTFEPGCRNNWHIHRVVTETNLVIVIIYTSSIFK